MDNILQIFASNLESSPYLLPLFLLVALLAGIVASLSPCSLGILPLIISYVGGYSKDGNKKLLIKMISFSVGLSTILSIIGVFCALTGRVFAGISSPILMLIFASILVILGLNLIGILNIQFPVIVKKMPKVNSASLFFYPFIVGCFFALAASPCSSPILASIMAIATVSRNIVFSISLLFSFAIGQCVIVILFALMASLLKNMKSIAKYSDLMVKLSGLILIILGSYIYFRVFSTL
jgi:cytochrome c-type biogenesis protein